MPEWTVNEDKEKTMVADLEEQGYLGKSGSTFT